MTDTRRILALFPGQGSQRVGMGKELFDDSEVARKLFAIADETLGFSLSEICFDGPPEKLTDTAIAQPAILTVSTICYSLAAEKPGKDLVPLAAAGHSLGEYSALVAAGAIDFADAVLLVNRRGSYMQAAVPRGEGKMVAVLGKELSEVEDALASVSSGIVEAANINAPGQIVVAGEAAAVDTFVEALGGAKVKELDVSAPFHCALMSPAEEKLRLDLQNLSISSPRFPVYANYSASPTTDPEEIRESLARQVCGRVRWVESMEKAISEHAITTAVEFGMGATLTGMLKRINREVERINITSPANLDSW